MKILHLSTRLILGGSQENTVLSCEGQARLGHEVHLAFGPIYGPEGSLLQRVERFNAESETAKQRDSETGSGSMPGCLDAPVPSSSIQTHVIPNLVREISPLKDRRAVREIEGLIRRINPDIIHTHSSKAGILGRLAAWNVNQRRDRQGALYPPSIPSSSSSSSSSESIPAPSHHAVPPPSRPRLRCGIVHTIHGPPFMPIEGGPIRRAKVRAMNKIYELAERHAAQRCHVIVSVADAMTRQFLDRGIGRAERYITVRSGMETEPFLAAAEPAARAAARANFGLAPGDFVIGTVARLAQHKGHDDLLDALGEELRARPDWKLLWIGDGWWRDRLLARVRTLGLEKQVITTGLVPPERVPECVAAMDVLAHPSYREGLPRTVPQALLAGVCPVAYDADGTGEICRDGETGCLVKLSDRAGLRAACLKLYDHPDERARMAQRGQDECRRSFSAAVMVDQLENVYARAIELARAR